MVLYTCCKCNVYQTHIKTHYIRHLNRKQSCISDNKNIQSTSQHLNKIKSTHKDSYICKFCNMNTKYKQSYYRHLKKCKENPENKVKKLEKEIELLKQEKETHIINNNNNCNNIINNNNTINNTYNITLNNYKKEEIDYLTDDMLYKLIKQPLSSITNIIKQIHFNKKYPENHNLKLNNIQSEYINIYNNNIWEKAYKKDIIEYERDKSYGIIDDYYTSTYPHKNQHQDRFKKFKEAFEDEDEQLLKELYKKIQLMLYNSTKLIGNK